MPNLNNKLFYYLIISIIVNYENFSVWEIKLIF